MPIYYVTGDTTTDSTTNWGSNYTYNDVATSAMTAASNLSYGVWYDEVIWWPERTNVYNYLTDRNDETSRPRSRPRPLSLPQVEPSATEVQRQLQEAAQFRAQHELAERRVAEERARTAERERQQATIRAAAQVRGEKLLCDILGVDDFNFFKKYNYIDIPSRNDPQKKYRIRAAKRIGIVKLENERWIEKNLSLCIHPESDWQYVVQDLIATHVLLAKFDEPTLNRVANVHDRAA